MLLPGVNDNRKISPTLNGKLYATELYKLFVKCEQIIDLNF
jgi:hypothetical protein